jgi:xylose isomerase
MAVAGSLGILGSIDANRGDMQNGWDTDQFPNSVEEMTLGIYEIIKYGGLGSGGFNFDTKVRRESIDPADMFHGHIGAMDVIAEAFMNAAELHEKKLLSSIVDKRYAGWSEDLGKKIMGGELDLAALSKWAVDNEIDPKQISGQQELLENIVNRVIYK